MFGEQYIPIDGDSDIPTEDLKEKNTPNHFNNDKYEEMVARIQKEEEANEEGLPDIEEPYEPFDINSFLEKSGLGREYPLQFDINSFLEKSGLGREYPLQFDINSFLEKSGLGREYPLQFLINNIKKNNAEISSAGKTLIEKVFLKDPLLNTIDSTSFEAEAPKIINNFLQELKNYQKENPDATIGSWLEFYEKKV